MAWETKSEGEILHHLFKRCGVDIDYQKPEAEAWILVATRMLELLERIDRNVAWLTDAPQ